MKWIKTKNDAWIDLDKAYYIWINSIGGFHTVVACFPFGNQDRKELPIYKESIAIQTFESQKEAKEYLDKLLSK